MGGSTKKVNASAPGVDEQRGRVIDYLNGPGGIGRIGANNPMDPARVGVQSAGPVSASAWSGSNMNRGQIRDVTGRDTQSVDQLGGANSAFFQNMVGQLSPSFDMERKLSAAQGSESAGNLTGSGFANSLGNNLGRTLGSQQALLADYATRGMQMEMQRQQGDANRTLSADQGNQGADLGFMGNMLQGRGQDLTARGQDIGISTGNADRQQGVYNLQGGLDQQRNLDVYGRQMDSANSDANRFLQLLMQQSQPTAPVISQSGGAGSLLGPLATLAGGYFGGGGKLPSWLGGGRSGGGSNPGPQATSTGGGLTPDGMSQIFGTLMAGGAPQGPSGPGYAGNPNGGTPPGAMSFSGGPNMNVQVPMDGFQNPGQPPAGMERYGGQPMNGSMPPYTGAPNDPRNPAFAQNKAAYDAQGQQQGAPQQMIQQIMQNPQVAQLMQSPQGLSMIMQLLGGGGMMGQPTPSQPMSGGQQPPGGWLAQQMGPNGGGIMGAQGGPTPNTPAQMEQYQQILRQFAGRDGQATATLNRTPQGNWWQRPLGPQGGGGPQPPNGPVGDPMVPGAPQMPQDPTRGPDGRNVQSYGLAGFNPYTPAPYTGNGITSGGGNPQQGGGQPGRADPSFFARLMGQGRDGGQSQAANIGGLAGSYFGRMIPGIGQTPLGPMIGHLGGQYAGKELGKAGTWLKRRFH